MQLEQLVHYFESSPAVRLLRAQNAPYVLRFLYEQFKIGERIAIPHSELLPALASFQDQTQELYRDALRDRAEAYLADWCSREKLWLKRFMEAGRDEAMYQLTPTTEGILDFLGRTLERGSDFVGTESRLKHVIDTLEKVVVGASHDPTVHLRHLTNDLRRIQQQIDAIHANGQAAAWTPTRIREQFALAVSLLRELQRDFRAVEERFKEITHEVQLRHGHGLDSRGGILAGALDAVDELRSDDQGVSFYEFFRFIQSPEQQDRLREIVRQLERIRDLAEQSEGLAAVRRMMPLLLAEANKVTETERRLSATLRRLLDVQGQRERRRVADLLREIRTIAIGMADAPPRNGSILEFDESLRMGSPVRHRDWSPPARFDEIDFTVAKGDSAQRQVFIEQFVRMYRIDFRTMRSNVRDAVTASGAISLRDLLAAHPPTAGVIDVVGYLQIASEDGHLISDAASEEIVIPSPDGAGLLEVSVPIVTFVERNRR